MRIEAARLSSLLQTLRQESRKTGETDTSPSGAAAPGSRKASARDPAILRARLRTKLRALKPDNPAFDEQAPTVIIQEVLSWEFGHMVLEHPDFHRVVQAVTDTLRQDPQLATSMAQLIVELGA